MLAEPLGARQMECAVLIFVKVTYVHSSLVVKVDQLQSVPVWLLLEPDRTLLYCFSGCTVRYDCASCVVISAHTVQSAFNFLAFVCFVSFIL